MSAAPIRSPPDVVVVGAGAAGLAAALRLKRGGHQVTVLEVADKVGGKMQTTVRDGFTFDRGPTAIFDRYANVLGIVRDAGLEDEVVRTGGNIVGFPKPGEMHYVDCDRLFSIVKTGLLSPISKLLMGRVFLDNRRLFKRLSYEDLSIASTWDVESAADYAARRTNPEIAEYIVDCTVRGVLGTRAHEVSVLEFFFAFNNVIGSRFLHFRHGMGSYPQLLAEQLDAIELGAQVTEVRETGSDVEVNWRDIDGREQTVRAAGCVVAVPAHPAAQIVTGLDAWRRQFLATVDYSCLVSINVALSRPLENMPASWIQVPSSVEDLLLGMTIDHNRAPEQIPTGKGFVTIYATSHRARPLLDASDETIIAQLRPAAEKLLGPLPPVEWIEVDRWPQVVVQSHPGYYTKLARFHDIRRARDKRVQLAGDYFSSSNVNTATASGERAARDLAAILATASRPVPRPAVGPAGR
jgi:oxygen-dependent protoporphyrinogen oxidase